MCPAANSGLRIKTWRTPEKESGVLPARRASVPLLYRQLENGETIQPRPSVFHLAGAVEPRCRCTRRCRSVTGSAAPYYTGRCGVAAIGPWSNFCRPDLVEWEHPSLRHKSHKDSRL